MAFETTQTNIILADPNHLVWVAAVDGTTGLPIGGASGSATNITQVGGISVPAGGNLPVVEAQGAALNTLNITMAGASQQLPSNATPNSGFIINESATNMRIANSSAVSATVGFLLQPGGQHPILTQNMNAYYLFGTGAVSVIWAV